MLRLESKIVNVGTTFLHGDLTKEIYIDFPEGLDGGGK